MNGAAWMDMYAEEGSVLQHLCNATVPQVASMFHQEWIDNSAVIFLISGNVVEEEPQPCIFLYYLTKKTNELCYWLPRLFFIISRQDPTTPREPP